MNIAIDGPAGAGKSTIAKEVARKLGSIYVDTGAMYRAMALYMIRRGIASDDHDNLIREAEHADIRIVYHEGGQHILLDGEDVTGFIRDKSVTDMASRISQIGEIREILVNKQRKLAEETSVVMDGRDIGTVVLPDAEVKIFLTADPGVRALRRAKEISGAEEPSAELIASIEKDIRERDERDMTREVSPLKMAEDANLIDSSYMSPEEVADAVLRIAGEK